MKRGFALGRQLLGLHHHPTLTAPALARLVAQISEATGGFSRRLLLLSHKM